VYSTNAVDPALAASGSGGIAGFFFSGTATTCNSPSSGLPVDILIQNPNSLVQNFCCCLNISLDVILILINK
jgi:hypothetical protein